MASLFRYTVEPIKVRDPDHGVIDERMIRDAVREDEILYEEEARDLAAQAQASAAQGKNLKALIDAKPVFPQLELHKLPSVQLSFRSILSIANLRALTSLRVLKLDNNRISRIEGLDTLHDLEELDLSFNRIEKIENLTHNTKLTDLLLASNKIRRCENLSHLTQLQILTLGNNSFQSFDSIAHLRRLPKLKCLSISGNVHACQREPEYRGITIAKLPQLKWLDYTAITGEERTAAEEAHVTESEPLRMREERLVEAKAEVKRRQDERSAMQKLGMHFLAGLWGRISGQPDDDDGSKLMKETEDEQEGRAGSSRAGARPAGGSSKGTGSGSGGDDEEEVQEIEDEDDLIDAEAESELLLARNRVLRIPGMQVYWARYARSVTQVVLRALERGTVMGHAIQREERDVDEALRRVRQASDVESVKVASMFRNFLKKVRRRLEEEDTTAPGGLGHKVKQLQAEIGEAHSSHASTTSTRGRGAAAGGAGGSPGGGPSSGAGSSDEGAVGVGPTEHPLFGIELTPREQAVFRLDGQAMGPDEALELLQLAHQKNEETRGRLLLLELRLHESCVAVLDAFHTAFNDLCDKRRAFLDNTLNEAVSLEDWFGKNSKEHIMQLVERYAEDPESAAPQLLKAHLSKHNIRDPRILSVIRADSTADAAAQRAVDEAKAQHDAAARSGGAAGSGDGSADGGAAGGDGQDGGMPMGGMGSDGAAQDGSAGEGGEGEEDDEGSKVGVRLVDMPEDLAAMLGDRDTADGMIAAAAEARLGQVFAVLDEVKKYDQDERHRAVDGRKQEEVSRDRLRIEEISAFAAGNRKEIQDMVVEED